jgi:hypothetical protein
MRIVGLLFIAIIFLLNPTLQMRCGRLFPLILGGKNDVNYGNQLEYHAKTGQLAMAASTIDQYFAGSANRQLAGADDGGSGATL